MMVVVVVVLTSVCRHKYIVSWMELVLRVSGPRAASPEEAPQRGTVLRGGAQHMQCHGEEEPATAPRERSSVGATANPAPDASPPREAAAPQPTTTTATSRPTAPPPAHATARVDQRGKDPQVARCHDNRGGPGRHLLLPSLTQVAPHWPCPTARLTGYRCPVRVMGAGSHTILHVTHNTQVWLVKHL
ncbi:hypothetical protein E2C01_024209 [Portunus trituberculatus]|uniref:Uncharacterized protein n=1 Tax=Portunus trituberculatus TaxID=210409 RepID=A0A5B7EC02_PORTR|nr:hypothetical protein [Portunus trituberculatus]